MKDCRVSLFSQSIIQLDCGSPYRLVDKPCRLQREVSGKDSDRIELLWWICGFSVDYVGWVGWGLMPHGSSKL